MSGLALLTRSLWQRGSTDDDAFAIPRPGASSGPCPPAAEAATEAKACQGIEVRRSPRLNCSSGEGAERSSGCNTPLPPNSPDERSRQCAACTERSSLSRPRRGLRLVTGAKRPCLPQRCHPGFWRSQRLGPINTAPATTRSGGAARHRPLGGYGSRSSCAAKPG